MSSQSRLDRAYKNAKIIPFDDSSKFILLSDCHRGDNSTDPEILKKVLIHGPPKRIENKTWSPKNPMIVASPQLVSGNWKAEEIHEFISYLVANNNIDTQRIYITGLSLGGYGSFNYVSRYGSDGYAAAIVPIAGGGEVTSVHQFKNIPVWAFHGDKDLVVPSSQSIDMIAAINKIHPKTKAKLTLYPEMNHDSWTKTYDTTGTGEESTDYDPFDISIYDWMFLFTKE